MNTLEHTMLQPLMQQYEDVLETLGNYTKCSLQYSLYTYVPSLWDILPVFQHEDPDIAIMHIIQLAHNYKLFLYWDGDYCYVPIKEVW